MKVILRKDNFLAAISERPAGVKDDKWNEMDRDVVANFRLAVPDGFYQA